MHTPMVLTRPMDFGYELEEFRAKRLQIVSTDLCPFPLEKGGKILLHLLPQTAFDRSTSVELGSVDRSFFPLFGTAAMNMRFNADGKVVYSNGAEGVRSYTQLFHNGIVEAVCVFAERNGNRIIKLKPLRQNLIEATRSYLSIQRDLGVTFPVVALLTLSSAKGYGLHIGDDYDQYTVDRDALLLPQTIIDSFDAQLNRVMKPLFDRLWNAAGVVRCFEYDREARLEES